LQQRKITLVVDEGDATAIGAGNRCQPADLNFSISD